MTKFILWLFCAVLLIFGVNILIDNPGFVSISWFGYIVETSVAFCIGLVFTFVFIFYVIAFPKRWLIWIRKNFEKKRLAKSNELLVQILTNLLCGQTNGNDKLIKNFQKYSKEENILLILKALSKTDDNIYKQLIKNPQTEQVGYKMLIEKHLNRGEITLACEKIEELMQKDPKKEWVLKEAFNLFVINDEWEKALNCLERLNKSKLIDKQQYNDQKAVLLVKLNKGTEAFRLCPALPAAAILAAKESPKKAEKIYQTSWETKPSFDVYKAYVRLYAKENYLAQYKHVLNLCEHNKNARINALVIADAAIKANLWSEAKKELNGYIAQYPLTVNVITLMMQIEAEANHNVKEAQKWLEKMNTSENVSAYICTKCNHKTDNWEALCPVCNSFNGLQLL